jgi:hypothetical protein
MSQYEFESNHDGDWDDHEDIAWNEADWQKFLRNSDKEVARFIAAYNKVKSDPDRLDATATIMGWHRDDWSSMDEIDMDDEDLQKIRPVDIEEVRKMDPYTIHRHPVYISSTALFSYLRAAWDQLMRNNRKLPEASLSWSYSSSLADAEKHCVLAANCLDLGDFLLAICHLKKAHSALNESMRLNRLFSHHSEKFYTNYIKETDLRMHDLREIFLRIIQDCRR